MGDDAKPGTGDLTNSLARFRDFLDWPRLVAGGREVQLLAVEDGEIRRVDARGTAPSSALASGAAQVVERVDTACEVVRGPDYYGTPAVHEAPAPDGLRALTELDGDLAIRDLTTRQVTRLTHTGSLAMPWRVNGQVVALAPTLAVWSPEGDRVVSVQADLQGVPVCPVVDWLALPVDVERRVAAAEGIPARPSFRMAVIELVDGAITWMDLDPAYGWSVPLRWSLDGKAVWVLATTPAGRLDLLTLDPATGASHTVASEDLIAPLAYLPRLLGAVLTSVPGANAVGWLSDRDGDLRLYALSPNDGLMLPLTPPGVQVERVVGPTGDQGLLVLARTDVERPYDVHVCRTDADGSFTVLTRATGVHEAIPVPDGNGFVDVHSSLTRPWRSELRGLDGKLRAVLDVSDTTTVDSLGRAEPMEFWVTAADGVTPLRGVLYRPPDFDPDRRYPVIDSIYGGPQAIASPNAFSDAIAPDGSRWSGFATLAQAFAQLGFLGVVLDGRGTPGRGREFQWGAYQTYGTVAVDDHATALRELARRHPWMDLGHCGVIGMSFGGYHAARCGLLEPDVFRAVVAVAGPYDLQLTLPGWYEPLLGVAFTDDPVAYARAGLVARAAEFKAELLLIHGTSDVNVSVAHSMRFSDALVRAGKHHKLLLLQNQNHQLAGAQGDHALEAAALFFLEHLAPARE